MTGTYKLEKETFVSGMTGSSITHINLICLVALVSVSLYAAIQTRFSVAHPAGFLSSWALLVLPMLLAMTVAAEKPMFLVVGLALPLVVVLRVERPEPSTSLPSTVPPSPSQPQQHNTAIHSRPTIPALPALTTYRAHMMLMTVLAILAVDFPVFPRALAKCETFGVSLMDLGVGSFVFSQGIVSAIPLVREPGYLTAPLVPKVFSVTRKCLPIIALGVVRVLLVKGTEYPEHVTEYGVHWNFFITLALLPILQVFLHPLFALFPISAVAVLVGLAHQFFLSQLHLRDYALSAPRTSLISANKEGLVSLPGYLAIQLLGLSVGTLVLPPSPSFFRRRRQAQAQAALALASQTQTQHKRRASDPAAITGADGVPDLTAPRQIGKTATELCAYAILWWALLGLARILRVDGRWSAGEGVSRRIVNVSYVLWVAAFNTSFLLGYLVVLDMWMYALPKEKRSTASRKGGALGNGASSSSSSLRNEGQAAAGVGVARGNPPLLLEALNRHGLAVFLLANVLTGAVNLSMKTMYVSDARAMVVLSVYSLVVCGVPWVVEARRKRKIRV